MIIQLTILLAFVGIAGGIDQTDDLYLIITGIRPYAYLVHIEDGEINEAACTAVLISVSSNESTVGESDMGITAARCLCDENGTKKKNLRAILGKYDPEGRSEHESAYNISDTVCHPHWAESGGKMGDIGLFRLDKPAKFNEYVQPIEWVREKTEQIDGEECSVHGWGATDMKTTILGEKRYIFPKILQECQLKIDSTCANLWPDMFNETSMVCALGQKMQEGAARCSPWKGDTGGPLICQNDSLVGGLFPRVRGLFSFGGMDTLDGDEIRRLTEESPKKYWTTVYTRLSAYSNWIDFWKIIMTRAGRSIKVNVVPTMLKQKIRGVLY